MHFPGFHQILHRKIVVLHVWQQECVQKVHNPVKDIEPPVQSETDKMHCQCGYSVTQCLGIERKQTVLSVFKSEGPSIHGSLTNQNLFETYLT